MKRSSKARFRTLTQRWLAILADCI